MTARLTTTQAKAHFLALIDRADNGETVEITKHGRVVARIVPARGPNALRGKFQGIASTTGNDDDLFQTGEKWENR